MMKKCISVLCFFSFLLANAQISEMKVSSFNMRYENSSDNANGNGWARRYPVIVNIILFHDLDIVGTQECIYGQINDLKNNLPGYDYIGRGRDTNPTDGEYSAIFYKAGKYNLIREETFWLSDTPDIPSNTWGASLNRICTWGEFEEKETGFRFYFFNLHLDHRSESARKKSSELVLLKIDTIAKGTPVFLTGDFNVDQHSEVYDILANSCLIYDSYELAPIRHAPIGTANDFSLTRYTTQRIDHVFVTEHFYPTRYGVLTDIYWSDIEPDPDGSSAQFPGQVEFDKGIPRLPSDHYPIVVEVKYSTSG